MTFQFNSLVPIKPRWNSANGAINTEHHHFHRRPGQRKKIGKTREGRRNSILEERLMRPACNSTTPAVHAGNSPIPYLFSGLGLMFGLVAVALMILACSYRKSSSSSASTDPEAQEKSVQQGQMKAEMEPKIVVIMAGDDSPTYLAMPVSCNCQSDEQV